MTAASTASRPPTPERAATPVAELIDVRLALGGREILTGVTLSVDAKERLVVLGASGSGKSTILRLLLGILGPDAGVVRFGGSDITRMSRWRLNRTRRKIGMVYQYSALLSSLNVRDNLALPLEELSTKSRKDIDATVEEKLTLVGMADALSKMPNELSGGMKKRVALARALVLEPALILYDEPSAGLDPVISSTIDDLIISLSEKTGAASVIVTHEMDSAFKIATRMAMLHEGKIHIDASPEEFRTTEDPVVAQFVRGSADEPPPLTPIRS